MIDLAAVTTSAPTCSNRWCRRAPAPRRKTCAICLERSRKYAASRIDALRLRYQPLDELLELDRVRILRLLRHHDWLTSNEMRDLLDLPTGRPIEPRDCPRISKFLSAVGALRRGGCLEQRVVVVSRRRTRELSYRITTAGRAELARLLRRAEVTRWV